MRFPAGWFWSIFRRKRSKGPTACFWQEPAWRGPAGLFLSCIWKGACRCFPLTRFPLPGRGLIPATVCQEPFEQGYRAVKLLFDYLVRDMRPPERYYTRTVLKIRENLEEPENRPPLECQENAGAFPR